MPCSAAGSSHWKMATLWKISPTLSHQEQQTELLIQGRMDGCFYVACVTVKLQQKLRLITDNSPV